MRRLREILTAYGQLRDCPVHCLSLVDPVEEGECHPRPLKGSTFEGCARHKPAFVLKAVRHGIRCRDGIAVIGHIGQAPVAWVLQQLGLLRSYILVLHGIEAWKKVAWLNHRAARDASCVVATTRYTAQEFCKHNGVQPDRLRIIPLAVAEEQIELTGHGWEGSGNLSILTVGRLWRAERYKGVDTLLEALEKVQNDGARVRLTVVGDGDDLPRLKELASRLGLDRRVTFLGIVSDAKLWQLYQECDVFAMTSRGEGFGIVFLEAMGHGKPCIGGNHGGTPEVIDHRMDGYLVDYGDVDQLARYLVEFSQRPALRQDMGLRGYEKVKARYLFPHMRENWFRLLDEILNMGL
jgi:phosphatidylinositol alpha-1,6-mannosyltransferase